jgi:aldehyde dehydrogenase (NAD+)
MCGLSGTVFSADPERAYAVARRVRTGQVGIDRLELAANAPFGGFKHSGIGREGGVEGLEEFSRKPRRFSCPAVH